MYTNPALNQQRICTTCGTQYAQDKESQSTCPICEDDRQYIPEKGQAWTSLAELSGSYSVIAQKINDRLYGLQMAPVFAIGQRALLVLTPGGNILWDCISLLNEPTIEFIKSKGGLKAIAFSHPHYYTTMNEWAAVFDCPIFIHQADAEWVFNKGRHISFWNGREKELWDGIRIINAGGHFPGSSILHVPFLSPNGAVLCGDTFYIAPSKKHIGPMYSYPNHIPLPVKEVQRIREQMLRLPFDTMFGFYGYQDIHLDAKTILDESLGKYM